MEQPLPCSLLELPDACLLAVLQCVAADDDPASLASAALTHSRLQQVAVAALSSISVPVFSQGDVDSLLLYLDRHGQHISSLDLDDEADHGGSITLRQLPTRLVQLSSLQLEGWHLQLQPGGGFQGVVRPRLPLKQLRLQDCKLLDGEEGLAAALSLLPGLEHLSYTGSERFPPQALLQLQHLTYLDLHCDLVQHSSQKQPALQPLQSLSRLVDLRLESSCACDITAGMLSGSPHLTLLHAAHVEVLEPGALAGKTALQHLYAAAYHVAGGTAGVVQLLLHVQQMQQLTYLDLACSLVADEHDPPAAAFAALTASSKLQDLGFNNCFLQAGVWQHVFPAGRQLPHLTALHFYHIMLPSGEPAAAPEGSCLVSCCPGLRCLNMYDVKCSTAHLAGLQGLRELHTLQVDCDAAAAVRAIGLLTQLRELQLWARSSNWGRSVEEGLLLHLTRLKQLTLLEYFGARLAPTGLGEKTVLQSKGPDDEPVWRQLLQLDYSDPDVAQQAAAALAACDWHAGLAGM